MATKWAIALAFGSTLAWGQSPSMHEYCTANSTEKLIADATALVIDAGAVSSNSDGTFRVDNMPNETFGAVGTDPYCPEVPFFGQDRATSGRTAFLVGSSLMVTAAHTATYNPVGSKVIFGLNATQANGVCAQPDFDHVPAANIYAVSSVQYVTSQPASPGEPDYMLISLDRSVPGIGPIPIRRRGSPDVGDPLTIVGHANRLSTKVSLGGPLDAIVNGAIDIGTAPRWDGSSGSAVFNGRSNLVETVVAVGGLTSGTWRWVNDPRGCVANVVAPDDHQVQFNNGDMLPFAAHVPIPPTELQVSPLTTVVHKGPVGGPLTNGISQFTVAAPSTATGPLSFKVSLPLLIPPAPALSVSPAPGNYSVSTASGPMTFTVTGGNGAVSACKVVDTAVGIVPLAGGFTNWARHRFEIGMANFDVSPTSDWIVSELGAPYPTHSIVVRNTYSEPAHISVSASVPWIRINGASSQTIDLAPAGTTGDQATVVLSFDDSATGFPASSETQSATVTVQTTQSQCSLRAPQVINVVLTHGVERFSQVNTTTEWLPGPVSGQLFGPPTDFPVDVDEDAFQVDHLSLAVGFNEASGIFWPPAIAAPLLKIALIGPDGTTAVLWDRNTPTSNYLGNEMIDFLGQTAGFGVLKLDQSASPPLGPDALTIFAGKSGAGQWTVRLWTTDTTHHIQPSHVSLHITKKVHAEFFGYNYVYDWLPAPAAGQTFGAPADLIFDLSSDAGFIARDIDLTLGFYNGLPYFDASQVDQLLQVQVIAPNGTIATLWDRNNAPPAYLGGQIVDWLGSTYVTTLTLNDQSTPPLGPNLLGLLRGLPGNGTWTVRLRTTDTSHRILLSHAQLNIER